MWRDRCPAWGPEVKRGFRSSDSLKTFSGEGFLPLTAVLLTSSPCLASSTHSVYSLPKQPFASRSVCLGLPQQGEAEEEAAKDRTAQQLHGRGLALVHGQLLVQAGPEHLPGWTGLRAWPPPAEPLPQRSPLRPSLRMEPCWGVPRGSRGSHLHT